MARDLVYVPMAADIIHPGHMNILKIAASYGDVMVGLFTDEAIASYVVQVVPQYTKDYEENLTKYKPKYMVHGKDWREGPLKDGREKAIKLMAQWGGEVIEPDYTQGVSSSMIQEKIKNRK